MNKRVIGAFVALGLITVSAVAWATFGDDHRHPVDFYPGHTHDENGEAINAPAHSGGTDKYGCHNGSVPYHCH